MSSKSSTNGNGGAGSTTESVDASGPPDGDDGGTEDQERASEDLSRDLIFDALRNSRRRQVLRYLDENEPRARLGELAEHIAAIENDTTTAAIDSTQRKRVYVGLYQCHLPRLDDMGIVEFDQARGRVEVGPAAPQLEKYLAVEDDDDRPWYSYHAAFTAASAAAVLLAAGTGLVGTAGGALLVMLAVSVAFASAVAAFERLR